MTYSWILFFSYQDDARSNTHQIYSGGNLALNDWPQSGSHVTATHNLNRQKFNKFIQDNQQTSQRAIAKKNLSIILVTVNEFIAGLGYKKVFFQ